MPYGLSAPKTGRSRFTPQAYPFPNTAYAKLSAGIPSELYYNWSLAYFRFTLNYDLLTYAGILGGLAAGALQKNWRSRAAVSGIPFYLFYLARIGGDFMGGRFFALPLFCAAVLLSRLQLPRLNAARAAVVLAVMSGLAFQSYIITPIANNVYKNDPAKIFNGVMDERLFYSSGTGLVYLKDYFTESVMLGGFGDFKWPLTYWQLDGERMRALAEANQQVVFVSSNIGYRGFYAGPKAIIVDFFALSDPLLARLPLVKAADWRVGHLPRPVPEGYIETLESGRNQLQDPGLAAFYEHLSLITQGPLFDPARLNTIWEMNLGKYDSFINRDRYSQMALPEKVLPKKYWLGEN